MGIINEINFGEITSINGAKNRKAWNSAVEIDEIKEHRGKLTSISVESHISRINIYANKNETVLTRLHGEIYNEAAKPVIEIERKFGGEFLCVTALFSKNPIKTRFISSELTLDIYLPIDTKYDLIDINAAFSDILLPKGVCAKRLNLSTQSGNIRFTTGCPHIMAKTLSGNLTIHINAEKSSNVSLHTMSGNICLDLENAKDISIQPTTISGGIKMEPMLFPEGFLISGNLSTMSGDILVR